MHRRTARGNRLGLAVVGVLLLAGGLALVAAQRGLFGSGSTDYVFYSDSAAKFVSDNSSWLWPVAGVVAVLFGLVFLRWLVVQVRTDTVRRLPLDSDGESQGSGRTSLEAGAVTGAVEDDLEQVRGVRSARANLTGPPDDPSLWVTVTTDSDADLGRIRRHLAEVTVPDLRAALESPDLEAQVKLEVSNRSGKSRDLS